MNYKKMKYALKKTEIHVKNEMGLKENEIKRTWNTLEENETHLQFYRSLELYPCVTYNIIHLLEIISSLQLYCVLVFYHESEPALRDEITESSLAAAWIIVMKSIINVKIAFLDPTDSYTGVIT